MSKRIEISYTDKSPCQSSYNGKNIDTTEIQLSCYDKKCGSPSVIEIKMSEFRESELGRFRCIE